MLADKLIVVQFRIRTRHPLDLLFLARGQNFFGIKTERVFHQALTAEDFVAGVLHQGSKMILGGASKSRKSWTLIDMMLSVSTGVLWWGLPTQRGRVLYINFELPDFAFQHRLTAIAGKKGITDFTGIDLWNLRGFATDFSVLIQKILSRVKDERYALIVLDPIYKGLGKRDENKAGDIASLCNEIEQLAVQSCAAVVFGAHYSKGNQAGKEAIDPSAAAVCSRAIPTSSSP